MWIFTVIILAFAACSTSINQAPKSESELEIFDNTKAVSGQYVRLAYALTAGDTIITARRGQPVGAPFDGNIIVYYKDKSDSFWKNKQMVRLSNTTLYSTSVGGNETDREFFLCLNVFNQCYYDHYASDPYKIGLGSFGGIPEYPAGIVGGNIAFGRAIIIGTPVYGTNLIKYVLQGDLYTNLDSTSGFNIRAAYRNGSSGAFQTIDATYSSSQNEIVHKYAFSKTISYGLVGTPPPSTYDVMVYYIKNQTYGIDNYFGKYYKVNYGIYTK